MERSTPVEVMYNRYELNTLFISGYYGKMSYHDQFVPHSFYEYHIKFVMECHNAQKVMIIFNVS